MRPKQVAEKFLKQNPIRDSYLIARVKNAEVLVDDSNNPCAVVLINDSTISMRGSENSLSRIIKEIQPAEYRFHSIDRKTFEIAKKIVHDIDDRPTWMLKRPRVVFDKPIVQVEELFEEDAKVINDLWGSDERDSTPYIRKRIRNGPAYGIRRNGELVAWCLTHYLTDKVICFGFLHVKEEWRRNSFAKSLTEALCEDAEEKNLIPVVDIFQDNKPSLSLAESLGFEKIGENHWFNGRI
ncbi:MAG: GNAT family N-acetyltransferase [Thermoplasmatota archaeon]